METLQIRKRNLRKEINELQEKIKTVRELFFLKLEASIIINDIDIKILSDLKEVEETRKEINKYIVKLEKLKFREKELINEELGITFYKQEYLNYLFNN
jgi:hypothetical protein